MNKIREKVWINKELDRRRIIYSVFFLASINSIIKKCDVLIRERKFVVKNQSKKANNKSKINYNK